LTLEFNFEFLLFTFNLFLRCHSWLEQACPPNPPAGGEGGNPVGFTSALALCLIPHGIPDQARLPARQVRDDTVVVRDDTLVLSGVFCLSVLTFKF